MIFVSIVLLMFVVLLVFDVDILLLGLVVEINLLILKLFGVIFVGFLLLMFKRFRLFLVLMVLVIKDLIFCVIFIVVYLVNMVLRKVKFLGMKFGIVSVCSVWVIVLISSDSGLVVWLIVVV